MLQPKDLSHHGANSPDIAPPAYLLASFCTVAEHRSITHAATALCLPYSNVAQQMARLETILGQRLIEHAHDKLALTELGQRLLLDVSPFARVLEQQALQTLKSKSTNNAYDRPSLAVELGVSGIATLLKSQSENLKQLPCDFNFVNAGVSMNTSADVVCYLAKTPRNGFDSTAVFGEEVVAVASINYPAPPDGFDESALQAEPLLQLGLPDHAMDWSRFLGVDPNLRLPGIGKDPYRSFSLYLKALRAGRGIGVGLAPLFAPDLNSGKLKLVSKRRLLRNRACYIGVNLESDNIELAHKTAAILQDIVTPKNTAAA